MTTLIPYINFQGKTEEAFNFYKSVLGGKFQSYMKFKDAPKEAQSPGADPEGIMNVALEVNDHLTLMGSDHPEAMGKLVEGNNFSFSLQPDTKEEADRLFNGLSAGGTVTMPMMQAFWNSYFGMCTDKYGIQWMINFPTPPQK